MKLAIFGATGNSGLQLVAQALQRNHEVTAIVRNPDKLASFAENKNFKIVKCDILNSSELVKTLEGQDCVLSALGSPGITLFKIKFYLESMQSIVKAMREANIKRLICITSFYSKPFDPNYPTIYKIALRPMIGRQLDNMFEMEEFLTSQCSDIDYTIVRPPRLLDQPLSDKKEAYLEDAYFFPQFNTQNQIPRANIARFMLDVAESNDKYIKKGVAIDLEKA